MQEDKILFVDVILTLHLPFTYCYRLPQTLNDSIKIGQRVAVQFGKKKIYSAFVINITEQASTNGKMKYVLDIIDSEPTLTQTQIKFFKWVSDYYVAYIGDVLTAALPSALRLKSETVVEISPYFNGDVSSFTDFEQEIIKQVYSKNKLKLEDYESSQQDNFLKTIYNLIKKEVLITDEELYSQYNPKKVTCISLSKEYSENEEKLQELFKEMDSKKRLESQSKVLLTYMSILSGRNMVRKEELLNKNCSVSTIQTLMKKGIFEKIDVEVSRLKQYTKTLNANDILLNEEQQKAYDDIVEKWEEYPISLLHGVTGSGKTEIYIKLIEKVINSGGQVLYLIPEIAITFQLIERLEQYFGNKIVVYNSKFSTTERVEIWNRVKSTEDDKFQIVLGSRSAVFLPFTDLRLVVIDEEHDTSFKQTEPVPHYNGKDSALYLAKLFKAKTVIASATPSIESYTYALENKYQLLTLKHRYSKTLLPEIFVSDVKESIKNKEMYGLFSKMLYDAIKECLENKQQVILFQNRRGYAPHIKCNVCGYVPKCPNCDVSLVLHKNTQSLTCHYCGHTEQVPRACPDCRSHSLRTVGIGTEKIEEDIETYFPNAKVMRMDLDSTRTKDAYMNIINKFSSGETDILVGTQIVSKGLDFNNVGLVGVIDADSMLHYPDFRAYERAFQILTQVSGRAGRRNKRGKVIIQTYEPYNQVIRDVCEYNYHSMYSSQMQERKLLNFPPFCRMIKITMQHKDRNLLEQKSYEYAHRLKQIFGGRMFGPQEPVIARIKNLYNREIWLKIEKTLSYSLSKRKLRELNEEFINEKDNKTIRIQIDIDPV